MRTDGQTDRQRQTERGQTDKQTEDRQTDRQTGPAWLGSSGSREYPPNLVGILAQKWLKLERAAIRHGCRTKGGHDTGRTDRTDKRTDRRTDGRTDRQTKDTDRRTDRPSEAIDMRLGALLTPQFWGVSPRAPPENPPSLGGFRGGPSAILPGCSLGICLRTFLKQFCFFISRKIVEMSRNV